MRDWKDTLNLPRTDFPMKANLPATEPAMLARWDAMDLYGQIRARRARPPEVRAARRPAVRQRQHPHRPRAQQDPEGLRRQVADDGGLRRAVRAGLGLPRAADRAEGRSRARAPQEADLSVGRVPARLPRVRRAVRRLAARRFKRLGVLGDWDRPVSHDGRPAIRRPSCARSAGSSSAASSTRARSPSTGASATARRWPKPRSSTSGTRRRRSTSSSRSSPSDAGRWPRACPRSPAARSSVLIWTTTPWTIPSNLAIAFHPDFDYGAYESTARAVIVAEALAERCRRRRARARRSRSRV